MDSFTDLQVWRKGLLLAKEVYALSSTFPRTELYALTSQIRRSSTSVLANFAEGHGRYTYADKANRYIIARGECRETLAFLLIAIELNFITKEDAKSALGLSQEVSKMLSGLVSSCRKRSKSS